MTLFPPPANAISARPRGSNFDTTSLLWDWKQWGRGLSFQRGFSAVPPPPPSECQHLQRGPDETHGTGGRDRCPGRGREGGGIIPDCCQTRRCLRGSRLASFRQGWGRGVEGPTGVRPRVGMQRLLGPVSAAQGVKKGAHLLCPSGNSSCWPRRACAMGGGIPLHVLTEGAAGVP